MPPKAAPLLFIRTLRFRPLRQARNESRLFCLGKSLFREKSAEASARRDSKFWKDSVKVILDGTVRDEQLLSDLTVGLSPSSQLSDLEFPWCQLGPRLGRSLTGCLPCSAELLPRRVPKLWERQCVEALHGRPQRRP